LVLWLAPWQRAVGAGPSALQEAEQFRAQVVAGLKRKTFVEKTVELHCGPGDAERGLIRDEKGRPRAYWRSGGSEDSAYTERFYYDSEGHLRFVFITAGSVSGRTLDHRIALDVTGRRIAEKRRGTLGYRISDEELVRDPEKAFAAPCAAEQP